MAKFSEYFKVVTPRPGVTTMADSQSIGDQGTYANYTWYQRLVQGAASRITRYREYDLMDNDVEIARSLDTIAEEMIGSNPNSDLPLELVIDSEKDADITSSQVVTLRAALRYWSSIHDWGNRLFKIARVTIKYGDCFFIRQKATAKWEYIHPKQVVAAIVDDKDMTKVIGWQIKRDIKTPNSPYNQPTGHFGSYSNELVDTFAAEDVVWFTLNDDISEAAPFGESVLRAIYRAHKQKELLEDAIIIYRIQRAPERRVFYIDVGKMPPQRVKAHLEGIKNEIRQRKIPTSGGGTNQVDAAYNPQQMCLSLDTQIPQLDGTVRSLSEMIRRREMGIQDWVHSIDPMTGDVVPGLVSWAGVTQQGADTIKLILSDESEVICTPEHKFPVKGMGFIEARDLSPEHLLWAFNSDTKHVTVARIESNANMDVGTLTIDQEHVYHSHHTFALTNCFTKNSEDFFFASRPDGGGSRVDTLPGGQGLGELSDLEYFQGKVFRGLRIPISFMQEKQENAMITDGKSGIAYIQELRFAMYIKRLQGHLNRVIDREFKRYIRAAGINIDPTTFHIKLNDPENFGIYRQQQLDNDLLSTYSQAAGIEHLSKRFAMKKFLQMTDEEVQINFRQRVEELGLDPDNGNKKENLMAVYGPPPTEGGMGMDGGMGGGMVAGTLGGPGFDQSIPPAGDAGMGMDPGMGAPPAGIDAGLGATPPAAPI